MRELSILPTTQIYGGGDACECLLKGEPRSDALVLEEDNARDCVFSCCDRMTNKWLYCYNCNKTAPFNDCPSKRAKRAAMKLRFDSLDYKNNQIYY